MVAIVSGNSLGLGLTSLHTPGQQGLGGPAVRGRSGEAAYLNLSHGNFILQSRDEFLAGPGADFELTRTYNSRGLANDDNGDNWIVGTVRQPLVLTGAVNTAGSSIVRTARDGAAASYAFDAARGLYVTTAGEGAHDTIRFVASDAQFEWLDGSTGATERYGLHAGNYLLLSTRDAAGTGFTYAYDAGGLLLRATSAGGAQAFFDYVQGLLQQVRTVDAAGTGSTRVRYEYDSLRRLSAVTVDLTPADNSIADGRRYRTQYEYEGSSTRVTRVTQGDGSTLAISYAQTAHGFVAWKVTAAGGQASSLSFANPADSVSRRTTVTNGAGQVTVFDMDGEGRLTKISAPAVDGVSASRLFAYDAQGNVSAVTSGEQQVTSFAYDAQGNRVLERDAAGNTVTRTFNSRNQVLTETVFAAPDPDGAGAALPGLPQTTRHAYDSATQSLLRFVISPEGRVTEHRYDGFGQRVSTLTYPAGAYPVAGLAADASPTEAQLSAWAATQDGSRLMRADRAYDAHGQLQSVTTYARTDASGQGLADGSQSTERYIHDQAGQLLQRITAEGGTTSYTYDGLGRVRAAVDAQGRLTVTEYHDADSKTVVTHANGLVTTQTYDKLGRLLSVLQTGAAAANLGETRYFHDAADRLRMTIDPAGSRHWMIYDAAGRKVADVDGNGTLTEYGYDRNDLLTLQVTYATAVSTSALADGAGLPVLTATLAAIRPASAAGDMRQWRAYDAALRLHKQARSVGDGSTAAVTLHRYDGASRLVEVVAHANVVATSAVGPGIIPTPVASTQDRSTRHFHDADGRLAGTLDAEGFLTTMGYDAAGRLVQRTAHAGATDPALRANGTLAQLQPAASAQDIRTLTWYDGKGQVIAEVDGEGYLTETVYDRNGNATLTARYANRVAGTPTPASPVASLRPAASAADRATLRAYDALDRLLTETNPEGVVTRYTYDAGGRLASTVRAAGTAEARTLLARHDLQGRLVAELGAQGAALLTGGQTQEQVDAIWAQHGQAHAYDAAGRRIATTDAAGNRTLFFYDADGALTHTVNALGEVQENRYDAQGRLSERIAYAHRIATAGLAGGLVPSALTAAIAAVAAPSRDGRATFRYTADGAVAASTDALGNTISYTYNAFGDQTGSSQPAAGGASLVQSHATDRLGRRIRTVADAVGANVVTSTSYDAFGRVIRTVDGNGNAREQGFDRLGRMVTTRDPLNASRSTSYDAFGQVLAETDALGHTTRYAYDQAARSVTVTTAEGVVSRTTHNRHGQVQARVDGNGNAITNEYDADGRLARTTTALASAANVHDAAGRLVQTSDANGHKVAYTYDAANRVKTRTVDPGGLALVTAYDYDGRGQQVRVTDPRGVVTAVAFDAAGQVLTRTVDPAGLNLATSYTYDARGQVLTVTTPGGAVTRYGYDTLGRRVEERVDPAGLDIARSWSYDRNGNAVTSTDGRGQVTRHVYDAANRLVFSVDPLGNVRHTRYDSAGRVTLIATYARPIAMSGLPATPTLAEVQARLSPAPQDQVEHRVHDKDGRLAATVDGAGGVTRYTYDANGNVVARVAHAQRIDVSAWLAAGGLPQVAADNARDSRAWTVYDQLDRVLYTLDGTGAVVSYTYDGNGNVLQRVAHANAIPVGTPRTAAAMAAAAAAVASPGRDALARNTFDAAGRLVWSVDGTGAVVQRVYDGNGNVVRHVAYATAVAPGSAASSVAGSDGDRVTVMAYDAADRQVFAVDALLGVTGQSFDADGRIVRRVTFANPLAALPALSEPGAAAAIRAALVPDGANDRVMLYGYDAAGRQVLTIDGVGASTRTEYDGAGHATARTAHATLADVNGLADAPTLAALLARIRPQAGADRTTRMAYDAAGRQVAETDPLGAVQRKEYDGIGRITRAIRANGAAETFSHDAGGRVLQATDAHGNTEAWTYDALGRKLSFVNKKGATWTYTYDAAGRLLTETAPQVWVTRASRNDTGAVSVAAPELHAAVTRLAYDALGNLTERTEAAGRPEQRTTRYFHDAAGRQVRVVHPAGLYYDAAADPLIANGAAGIAVRTEYSVPLETLTFYDALGNAVASRDVGGAISQKVYDRMGRLEFDVDAMGYVTGYARNAFGEVIRLTRVASRTGLADGGVAQASQAVTRAQMFALLRAPGFDHSANRTLSTSYDRAGRVTEAAELAALVYEHSLTQPRLGTAARTTRNSYDAFGQLVEERRSRGADGASWSVTNHYFDAAGRETATIDALGHLTTRAYDSVGNLTRTTEFATALVPGSWSLAGHAAGVAGSQDRTTAFSYDSLGRKTAETRLAVAFSTGPSASSTPGDVTTSYIYDALGNQTYVVDAEGNITCTSYDALGRIQAVGSPVRPGVVDGSSVAPLTSFQRDVHGNVVVQVEHAQGWASIDGAAFQARPDNGADRRTLTAYDALGRAIQRTDAEGASQFFSYDPWGNLAKKWQGVTDHAGNVRTVFEVNVRDRLGRVVNHVTPPLTVLTPQAGGSVASQQQPGAASVYSEFNAFGEMTRRGDASGWHEYFDYDTAGRLWRTNSGDGIDRIYLHDAAGNVTSEIRSSGSGLDDVDLRTLGSAQEAATRGYTRRTDLVLDALGRVTARVEAARREYQGGVSVQRQLAQVAHLASATPILPLDGSTGLQGWQGQNQLRLSWNSLLPLGSGDVKVIVDYRPRQTPAGAGAEKSYSSRIFTAEEAASGVQLSWAETAQLEPDGGIGEVTRLIVYKKDVKGEWRMVILQAPGHGPNAIDIAAPSHPDAETLLELRPVGSGSTSWRAYPAIRFGDTCRMDARDLPLGSYEYIVSTRLPGEAWRTAATGTVSLLPPPLATIGLAFGYRPERPGVLVWPMADPATAQVMRYRAAGSSGPWLDLPVTLYDPATSLHGVDINALPAGSYRFELLFLRRTDSQAYAHATGTFGRVPGSASVAVDANPGQVSISGFGGTLLQSAGLNGGERWQRPTVLQKHDRWGNVVEITDPRNAAWKASYAYNHANQLVRQVDPDASGAAGAVTLYFHDRLGRQTAVQDGNGHVSGQVWDAGGNLREEHRADGTVVRHRYNAFGDKELTTDAKGHPVSFRYDRLGRLVETNKGTAAVFGVGASNERDAGTNTWIIEQWRYDELGRRLTHINGNREQTKYGYDLRGNLVETVQPLGQRLRAMYDAQGRKTGEVDANGTWASWSYNHFGQLLRRMDLGGRTYDYTYDHARQLVYQSGNNGQRIGYRYDEAGQLTLISDGGISQVTTYLYDQAGRRIRERTVNNGVTYQDNHLSYDARGNLRDVADARVHIGMEYDAVGNRTQVATRVNYQGVSGEATHDSRRYFRYDEMNRQKVVDAIDANYTIGPGQGHEITYDANGNRASDTWIGYRVVRNGDGTFSREQGRTTETYRYDNLNRLEYVSRDGRDVDARHYDGADRVVHSGPPAALEAGYSAALNQGVVPREAIGLEMRTNRYDLNGRLMHQRVRNSEGVVTADISWDPGESIPGMPEYVANGYDAAGNALGYVVRSHVGGGVSEFATTLERFDAYQAVETQGTSTTNISATTRQQYDTNGFLVGVTDTRQPRNDRRFVNDANGRALFVNQFGNVQRQLVVNGEVLGLYGAAVDPINPTTGRYNDPVFANLVDFDFGYAKISASYPNASPGAYQVRAGETLQDVAQAAYGDSSLWYRIAEANGLASSSDLKVGQTLNIPNRVSTVSNNNTTFKPYDPSRIEGDTTPNLAAPPEKGCGGVGKLLMVVVAVVVTVLTAGALAPVMGPAAAAAGAATTGLAGALSAGAAALGGGIGFAGAAIAGAVGSIAGQLVGLATGDVQKFSWKGVALSALSAGVSAGLPSSVVPNGLGSVGTAIARAAIANTVTQGVAVAVGLQKKFDWRGVAASGVGAGMGQAMGNALGLPAHGFRPEGMEVGEFLGKSFVKGMVAGAAAAAARGGKVVVQQVAVDAFGNALGSSLADAMGPQPESRYSLANGNSGQGMRAPAGTWEAGSGDGGYDDTWRSQNLTRMRSLAAETQSASGADWGASTAMGAGPIAVLPSMYPAPQLVGRGRNAQGRDYYEWDSGSVATQVSPQSVLVAQALAPLKLGGMKAGGGWVDQNRASDQAMYNGMIANADNPVGAIAATLGRPFNNAFYDIAAGAVGLYSLATDRDVQARTLSAAINAITHPIDTGKAVYNAGAKYLSNTNGAQMAEDALRFGAGGFATAGLGKGATTLGGVALDGISATGQWLAPKATQMAESYLARTGGLAYAVEPGVSASGLGNAVDAAAFRANFVGPTIGKSGYLSTKEVSEAMFSRYQQFTDIAYADVLAADANGTLRMRPGVPRATILGQRTDRIAQSYINDWIQAEQLPSGLVQVNKYLRNPVESGSYRIPDVRVPSAGQIFDGTLGYKWDTTPQIRDFSSFSGGNRITIVRPTVEGGSYSIWR